MTKTTPITKRKAKKAAEAAPEPSAAPTTATAESSRPAWIDGPAAEEPVTDEPEKPWADPYKATFSCPARKFELGENRRFKQIVFTFAEKPDAKVLQTLKDEGYQYRAHEKAWTIQANAATRERATRLAQAWAGPSPAAER